MVGARRLRAGAVLCRMFLGAQPAASPEAARGCARSHGPRANAGGVFLARHNSIVAQVDAEATRKFAVDDPRSIGEQP